MDTAINGIFELERRLAEVVDCDNVYTIYFAEQLNVLTTICHALYHEVGKFHGISDKKTSIVESISPTTFMNRLMKVFHKKGSKCFASFFMLLLSMPLAIAVYKRTTARF